MPESKLIKVGIAGLGRSGWNIHADAIATMQSMFRVVAVVDSSPERLREAVDRFGCRAYERFDEFVKDESIDLIVVATPSHMHVDHVISSVQAGKHVICEKPMAGTVEDADRVIQAVEAHDRQVAVFHNRRFEPHFQKVTEIIKSGKLGRIVQARMAQHQFTRRWDWQTLREFNGGLINNIGSHLLDLLLQLFPMSKPGCFAHTDSVLTLGDAEDHGVLMFHQPGSPLLQVEITNVSAYDQDLWLILGTHGSLRGTASHIQWSLADVSNLPERTLERQPKSNSRSYDRDELKWDEHHWYADSAEDHRLYTHQQFYLRMHAAVCHGGPSPVSPQSVRPLIAALQNAHEQADQSCSLTVPYDAALRPTALRSPKAKSGITGARPLVTPRSRRAT